ncbi:MAG: LruC domain-containing protein [Prevotella sp.]
MRKLLLLCALITASGTFFLSSCSKDSNLYDPNQKVNEYNNSWNQQFGAIDPTQNWNVATTVSATAACPTIAGESEMRIYSDAPLEDESNLMAVTKLTNGTGSISFDAKKAANHVFVSIKNSEGLFKIYNYYAIVNGTVNITPSDYITPTRSGFTRAANNCPVTTGEKKTMVLQYESLVKDMIWFNYQTKTFEEWKKVYQGQGQNIKNNLYLGPFVPESIATKNADGSYNYDVLDFTNAVLQESAKWVGSTKNIELTLLNGVAQEEAVPCWTLGQGYKLFGPGSFFMEGQKYYCSEKRKLYNGIEGLKQVEKGFSIVTEGGEIKMPVVYGATEKYNRLGYIYYKDGQDPLAQPHYILMNDASPQGNIYFYSWKGQALNDNKQLEGWNSTTESIGSYAKDTKMYGTSYKLAFFGENHDQKATYDFPAGYHIVFFIAPLYGQYSDYNPGDYNYSLPELNKRIYAYDAGNIHTDKNTGCPTYDPTRGAIKAASWTFNGQTFLGFEDGTDDDLNDIVFWVEGQYKTPEPPITVPDPDPLPEPQSESWIIACEDLGNTDDIDFNDVVFSVSHTAGETTAKVTPLAAGGVLPSNIYHGGNNLGEIHNLINGAQPNANGQYSMLNTGSKGTPGSAITINVPADYSVTNHGFTVKVKDQNESIVLESAEIGTAPQMLVLPGEWAWPTERTPIGTAFPMFVDWSKAANTAIDWYKSPVEGKVVK